VKNSSGEWIAFIDADEIADSKWLAELTKNAPNYDGILGSINTLNPNQNYLTKYFDLSIQERISFLKDKPKLKIFGTGNLLISKKVFSEGVLFDNEFPTGEDGDFAYRFTKKGFKLGFNTNAKIYHRVPETIRQFYFFQKKMAFSNFLIFLKHKDSFTLMKLITTIFYHISPKFLKMYKRNNLLSRKRYILLGLTSLLIYLYCYLNPILLFKLKKKITRPK